MYIAWVCSGVMYVVFLWREAWALGKVNIICEICYRHSFHVYIEEYHKKCSYEQDGSSNTLIFEICQVTAKCCGPHCHATCCVFPYIHISARLSQVSSQYYTNTYVLHDQLFSVCSYTVTILIIQKHDQLRLIQITRKFSNQSHVCSFLYLTNMYVWMLIG